MVENQEWAALLGANPFPIQGKETPTTTITIFKENFRVEKELTEVDGLSTVIFKTVKTSAKVYLPDEKLMPLDKEGKAVPNDLSDPLIFELGPDQERSFVAINKDTLLAYFVTREVIPGVIEGLHRPPVIIIKKVNR